jgi:hypothetical protein
MPCCREATLRHVQAGCQTSLVVEPTQFKPFRLRCALHVEPHSVQTPDKAQNRWPPREDEAGAFNLHRSATAHFGRVRRTMYEAETIHVANQVGPT